MALSLLTSVILARYLGPEGRGALLVIIFWPTVILGVLQLSLNEATIYHLARASVDREAGGADRQSGSALSLQLLVAACTAVVSLLLLPVVFGAARGKYLPIAMFYAAAFTPLTILDLYCNAVRQGRRDIVGLNLLRLCQPLIYASALAVLVVSNSIRIETVLVAMVLATGVSVVLGLLLEGPVAPNWSPVAMRNLLCTGLRFHGANLLLYISAEVDKFMVIRWMDEARVGLYVAGLAVSMLGSGFVAQSLIVLACGRISSASGRTQQIALVCQFTQTALLCLILVNGTVASVCSWLVPMLYGKEFVEAVPVATILLVMNTFRGVRLVMDRALRATLSTRISVQSEAVGILCFVIFAPIGSMLGELAGIAWAMVGAQFLALIFMVVGVSRDFELAIPDVLGLRMSTLSQMVRVATRECKAAQERWLR
jgi:O-antigen/teichoic acid export membrane protein